MYNKNKKKGELWMDFNELIESYQDDIVKSVQDSIRIKSVEEEAKEDMPFGEGPFKALEYSLKLAEELGFKTKNVDNYAGHADLGEGEEIVGVLAHVDVVPEGSGWTYPPYAGEIHDGKIYGRGTTDDKGPAIAAMYAMKALKESGVELKRKIRIIFGTNEETGWGGIKYYFTKENPPTMAFTPDADFPVIYGEKGIIVFDLVQRLKTFGSKGLEIQELKGGNAPNMVPDSAYAVLKLEDKNEFKRKYNDYQEKNDHPIEIEEYKDGIKLIASGVSAHGSTPEKGKNAISYLLDFLAYIMDDSDISKFIEVYNSRIGFKHHGESIGCGFEDSESGKLNFNPGMIKLDKDQISLTINVRYPINSSGKEVYAGIRENLRDTNLELVEGEGEMKPLYVSKNNFLVETLMRVYKEETGDNDSKPITIGGGTYARSMENAVAFGPMFPGQEDVAHQKDEYISIEHLMSITKIYAKALYELAK